MVDKEMLSAISELLDEKLEQKLDQKFDEKLQPVYGRLDSLEANVIPRLDSLETDVSGLKADVSSLKTDVEGLKNDMRYVKVVQLENNVIPRLSTIESCYLDTFHRYAERTEQFDKMAADIEVLKCVASEHSRKLEEILG